MYRKSDNKRKLIIFLILGLLGLLLIGLFEKKGLDYSQYLPISGLVLLAGFLLPKGLVVSYSLLMALAYSYISLDGMSWQMILVLVLEFICYGFVVYRSYKEKGRFPFTSIIEARLAGLLLSLLSIFVIDSMFPMDISGLDYIYQIVFKGYKGLMIQVSFISIFIYIIEDYTTINFD